MRYYTHSMSHHHFSTTERSEIAILLKKSYSHHDIANTLGCSQSSVSREIRRNSVHGIYEPRKAKQKARVRRTHSKYQGMKVRERPDLQWYIIDKLEQQWTPEEISGRKIRIFPTSVQRESTSGCTQYMVSNTVPCYQNNA